MANSTDAWIVTASGRQVNLLDPDPESIVIEDIALALARLNRFTGHTLTFYCVAQHSVLVSEQCRRSPLAGLLHDAHEAYLGDVSRPLKLALRSHLAEGETDPLALIAANFDRTICERFGLPVDAFQADEIKLADNRLLATEKRDLVIAHAHPWTTKLPAPLPYKIRATDWPHARVQFLRRFLELTED
jgi:hypothetical protein